MKKTVTEIFWNYINSGEGKFFYKENLFVPFVNGFTLILLGLLVSFGILRIFVGRNDHGYEPGIILLLVAFLLILNVLYLRKTLRAEQAAGVIAFLTTTLGVYTFWEGSIFGNTGIFWVYPIPVLVFFLSGKTKGLFWSSVLLFSLYLLSILAAFNIVGLHYNILALQEALIPLIATTAGLYMYADFIERNRQSLREHQLLDRILLENIGEAVVATDAEGIITKANGAARKMLGWSEGDLIGTDIVKSIPCLDKSGDEIPKNNRPGFIATHQKISCAIEGYVVAKNGNKIPVAGVVNPVLLNNKTIATVGTFRDTTKEREMEKMRLDLLSLASHQLRTPLSGTKWLIETLKKGIHGKLTKKQTEYVDELYKINERMTGLVSDMLSTLRIETGFEEVKNETIAIQSMFDNIALSMSSAAQARNISLEFITSDKGAKIITAPELLRNILENLASNAIKYSHPKNQVIVTYKKKDNTAVFSVKDFGIGIPESEKGQLFNRFFRASNARTFNTTSSGLGLYIVATLTQKIGGKISFESVENQGSTFLLEIPLQESQSIALKK